jgi:hypothetical protein
MPAVGDLITADVGKSGAVETGLDYFGASDAEPAGNRGHPITQIRTFGYDSLGRLTRAENPETDGAAHPVT